MDPSHAPHQGTNPSDASTPRCSRKGSTHISIKSSWGTPIPPPSDLRSLTTDANQEMFDDVDLEANNAATLNSSAGEGWNTLDNIVALGLSITAESVQIDEATKPKRFSLDGAGDFTDTSLPLDSELPFNKWIKALQKRAGQRRKTVRCGADYSAANREPLDFPAPHRKSGHKKSSSGSSFGFVTAVKSASVSLASFSIAPRSRTGVSFSRHGRKDRSSKTPNDGRFSEDSTYSARDMVLESDIDQAVMNRSIQRRRVLEEIIGTEESYVADIKFLMNVYVTLLASIPTLSPSLRASINQNLNELVELHEELLGELHRVVPYSEYTQVDYRESVLSQPPNGQIRWGSLDAVPENAREPPWLQKLPGMTAEPKVAADVANVFCRKLSRFFIYEEYGAKYELMIKDVASTYRTIPQWESYQKGLEALASSLASISSQQNSSKKALAIGDLLVKPIQRVCKYPLLIAELLEQTPVFDCPDSHLAIGNILVRLREATTEINRATNDPRMKDIMEKSWLLQDRVIFPDRSNARSKSAVRSLRRIHLCGVLHVSWQTKDGADGQYLISLLYRDFLLLASVAKADQLYTVQACIALSELKVEEIDNGRGLQCHTVPYSWKLVFEYDHQLFEIILSTCSPKEELEWRSRLTNHSHKEPFDAGEQAVLTSFSLPIKSMGTVFGKPGTVARRLSTHRATVGPMSGLCQVIIKNTTVSKEPSSSTNINRSLSVLTTNRIPVIAPSRAERIRLESLLADVWTREVLPYPGMSGRGRGEHLVRASASSMIRKLSVASIASNFSKRSNSVSSLQKVAADGAVTDKEIVGPASTVPEGQSSSGMNGMPEADDAAMSRLSVIQDQRNNIRRPSVDNILACASIPPESPPSTGKRMGTPTIKKSWGHEEQRITTPPLRTSSANSLSQKRTAARSSGGDAPVEEKENIPQVQIRPISQTLQPSAKRDKSSTKSSSMLSEGIRNFFR
ncbi:Uncharacterized protein BP5553_06130 [Venustampulla echinocandica]|uniref:DH domain-containing protein n=1 Tax=Venustampulla echinocandica TaxID=2656787 RepID=A0A370TMP4_9HELO|nr:Uncharacterized protein BP5553_06130 [Venustampulla echinocandica]RDL36778.1 Uncharacterized protein BP5553_06130 [Venustampulla echinocandica]